jgi:hypothetical protein
MAKGEGGHKYYPHCSKTVETRVLPGGYSNIEFRGISAKRRHIICGTDEHGSNGCGTK